MLVYKSLIRTEPEIRHYTEKILKPLQYGGADNRYYSVRLDYKMEKIHRLVAKAFIPNPENKRCVDHINGDYHDNRIENLRWATHQENARGFRRPTVHTEEFLKK